MSCSNSGTWTGMSVLSLWERRARAALLLGVCVVAALCLLQGGDGGEPASNAQQKLWELNGGKGAWGKYVDEVFVGPGAPGHIIVRHHYSTKLIPMPVGASDQVVRVALWDHPRVPTAVLDGSPGFSALGRTDFLAWVAAGHNVVFLGGYESQSAMNQLFGFQLEYVAYKPGPYWRNERNVPGTPFQYGPARLEEESAVYGVTTDSIPLTGYSMYDTGRDSIVFFVKYHLGTVCYIGANYQSISERSAWGSVLRQAVRM